MIRSRFFRFAAAAFFVLVTLKLIYNIYRPSIARFVAQIVPGATWTASNTGEHIQAHGGGIVHVDGLYYWIGEDKSKGTFFHSINCYVSSDLVEWNYAESLLTKQSDGDLGPDRIVERPKVIYNGLTQKYVMYMHIDDPKYNEAKVGVATANTVCGAYTYHGSFRPLDQESRDLGLFQDSDGKGFLLTEDRQNGLRIDGLSKDYLSVESNVYTWSEKIESPALIQREGIYFMFGSHLTGWRTNDNVYSTAPSLNGPWSEWRTFAEPGSNTYNSQTNFVLSVGNTSIYMGDRWDPDNLMRSTYIWLPLNIIESTATMRERRNWMLDASGSWSEGVPGPTYEAESATLLGDAEVIECDECGSGKGVGHIEGTSSGVLFSSISSSTSMRATVLIHFLNLDRTQRFCNVRVNGGSRQIVAFLPTGSDATGTSFACVHVTLQKGFNDIELRGTDGLGPVLDKVEVLYP
ncbi:Arabinanase/levansucrase/invertase [Rhizodiscina lignyota]|uniref:Arabinanase/levansucrase/invertase n=1 Tax=Rhizodiscina lignyota TaxID=1504668 RepID=A0A9P4I9N3_9PEZI|nr:Arabinanase/levansucrase/invertase [Rhizodiscina lignyota]